MRTKMALLISLTCCTMLLTPAIALADNSASAGQPAASQTSSPLAGVAATYSIHNLATTSLAPAATGDISEAEISDIEDQPYRLTDGSAAYYDFRAEPSFSVSLNSKTLEGCEIYGPDSLESAMNSYYYSSYDYLYYYENNTEPGEASITIIGRGGYHGTRVVTFNIYAYISSSSTRCFDNMDDYYDYLYSDQKTTYDIHARTYTGKAITPKPIVILFEPYWEQHDEYDEWGDYVGSTTTENEATKELSLNKDYVLKYENNIKLGIAKVTITGIGHYKGSITKTFRIKYPVSKAAVSTIKKQKYKGKAIKPQPKVTCLGKTLKLNTDYTLSYKNNKAGGKATVTIKGKGNYYGSLNKTFEIKASLKYARIGKIGTLVPTSKKMKPKPRVKMGSKTLKRGRDYTLKYKKNTAGHTATVIVKGKGYFKGTKKAKFKILPRGVGKTISKAEFNRIKRGMSYREVKCLIGGSGSLTYEYTDPYGDYEEYYDEDGNYESTEYYDVVHKTYEWKGNNGYSGATIQFEDGYVTSKSQWGL